MISDELSAVLKAIYRSAHGARYETITLEHLLLGLMDDKEVTAVLAACHADRQTLHIALESTILATVPLYPYDGKPSPSPKPSSAFQQAIRRAIWHASSAGRKEATPTDVLLALFQEKDSTVCLILQEQNITRPAIIREMTRRQNQKETEHPKKTNQDNHSAATSTETTREEHAAENALEQYTVNLNKEALAGRIDPLVGRQDELKRMMQTLCRRRKNNPLLVGEAGVGKTALAEGLAWSIVHEDVPDFLKNAVIYALDLGALLAGTKYRGDFEARIKAIIQALNDSAENAVLLIDEIHTIIGAGSTSSGSVDASSLLKPALAKGQLRCIGATTYQEYRTIFERDHALSRRFHKIDINEPTIDETIAILKGLQPTMEAFHRVHYTDEALHAAARLSERYLSERFLPDKAIDVIDEAGAMSQIQPQALQQGGMIDKAQIEKVLAQMTQLPEKNINDDQKVLLRHLPEQMKAHIFGQDRAIDSLCEAVKLFYAGLDAPNKPTGSFLFSGPTGVGKTEVAKTLAKALGIGLIRFDMSEYAEQHAIARLIGAPPGYVGFEQGGLLTDAVHKTPYAVLLLDELEKAHPDIFNVLLQVMDYGTLTDTAGRPTDFRHIILIMTTNVGAEVWARKGMGFTTKTSQGDEQAALDHAFSPEFRNRLDAMISFAPLDDATIAKVVDKFLNELSTQLKEQNVIARYSERSRHYLARHGFDPQMGARPIARLLRNTVRRALADELLFGRLRQGGEVLIDIDEKGLVHLQTETNLASYSLSNYAYERS